MTNPQYKSPDMKGRDRVCDGVNITQAMNYMEAYKLEVGLLINFGHTRLHFHRFEL